MKYVLFKNHNLSIFNIRCIQVSWEIYLLGCFCCPLFVCCFISSNYFMLSCYYYDLFLSYKGGVGGGGVPLKPVASCPLLRQRLPFNILDNLQSYESANHISIEKLSRQMRMGSPELTHLLLLFEPQLLQLALLLGLQALGLRHVLRPQPLLQRSEVPLLLIPQTPQISLETTLQFLLLLLQLLPVCNTESWNTTRSFSLFQQIRMWVMYSPKEDVHFQAQLDEHFTSLFVGVLFLFFELFRC